MKTRKWEKLAPKGAKAPVGHKDRLPALGYFHPELNVLALTLGTKTWVYRYKKAEEN